MNIFFDNCLAVFQGGGCKALTYIGAYKQALKSGVHFNELAGTSAGSIIASLIAAGARPEELEEFAHSIQYKKLFRPKWYSYVISLVFIILISPLFIILILCGKWMVFKIFKIQIIQLLKKWGMYSTENLQILLEKELQKLTNIDREVKFKDLIPDLHVVAADINDLKEKIWSKATTPNESVSKAVCASCAIPLYFRPIDKRYVDGGILSNAPTHIFATKPNYSKILSFQTESNKIESAKGFERYIKRLISTIIDGAVSLQNSFGVEVYPITIKVDNIEATDFDLLTENEINKLIQQGSDSFEEFWKNTMNQSNDINVNALNKSINSYEQMYSLVATYSYNVISEVFVSCSNTKWVWTLFPTILKWINTNASVVVYAPIVEDNDTSNYAKEEKTRRTLLQGLGIPVESKDNPNVNGFFLQHKIKGETRWQGVFYSEKPNEEKRNEKIFHEGCYYDHKLDGKAIEAWVGKLRIKKEKNDWKKMSTLVLKQIDDQNIYSKFQDFPYYKDAFIEYKTIKIDEVLFLNHHIRLEKYRQIDILFDLYKRFNIPLFKASELILLEDDTNIISPIVLEKHADKLYVIEGNTRLAYAYFNGITELQALVIDNLETQLPICQDFIPCNIRRVLITDAKQDANMECSKYFRHIEALLHPCNK